MIKDYFYRLLGKYISIYARPGDKVLLVEPRSMAILSKLSPDDVLLLTNRPEQFTGYRTVEDISSAKEF